MVPQRLSVAQALQELEVTPDQFAALKGFGVKAERERGRWFVTTETYERAQFLLGSRVRLRAANNYERLAFKLFFEGDVNVPASSVTKYAYTFMLLHWSRVRRMQHRHNATPLLSPLQCKRSARAISQRLRAPALYQSAILTCIELMERLANCDAELSPSLFKDALYSIMQDWFADAGRRALYEVARYFGKALAYVDDGDSTPRWGLAVNYQCKLHEGIDKDRILRRVRAARSGIDAVHAFMRPLYSGLGLSHEQREYLKELLQAAEVIFLSVFECEPELHETNAALDQGDASPLHQGLTAVRQLIAITPMMLKTVP